ncbi:MAG: zinc-ribbon domain-containing protein [Acidobacteria bacterium]|nr:zinc-ribbon domain-containing protein [Acidobacteriota bacterium]
MFCPNCAAQNIEDSKFCRGCGADIGLVPQAMTGHLPVQRAVGYDAQGQPYDETGRRISKHKEPPRLDKAITNLFTGVAFLLVAFSVMRFFPGGRMWWFWLLIPAFTMLGGGVAEYVRFKQSKGEDIKLPGGKSRPAMPKAPARVSAFPPRNTSELVPPPSITEGTTRHLDQSPEAPTRHIGTHE